MKIVIPSPYDPRLYASVLDHVDGSLVEFWCHCRRSGGTAKRIGAAILPLPYHVARDVAFCAMQEAPIKTVPR